MKGRFIPYDLESYPLHLKTVSKLGSGDVIFVGLTSPMEIKNYQSYVRILLTLPPRLGMGDCNDDQSIDISIEASEM